MLKCFYQFGEITTKHYHFCSDSFTGEKIYISVAHQIHCHQVNLACLAHLAPLKAKARVDLQRHSGQTDLGLFIHFLLCGHVLSSNIVWF